jgi:integrase
VSGIALGSNLICVLNDALAQRAFFHPFDCVLVSEEGIHLNFSFRAEDRKNIRQDYAGRRISPRLQNQGQTVPPGIFRNPAYCRLFRERHSRHSTAMHLLQAGVDVSVIALMLGHESPTTTHQYVELDLRMKEQCLHKLQSPKTKLTRFKPSDLLLAFLETL